MDHAEGVFKNLPIQAKGQILQRNQHWQANNLQLALGNNRLLIDGALDGALDGEQGIAWDLDAKDLTQFSPKLQGVFKGKGVLTA